MNVFAVLVGAGGVFPLSAGEAVDLDSYGRATSHLRRLFETLGLERRTRDVTTPSIAEYLEQVRREGEKAEDQ